MKTLRNYLLALTMVLAAFTFVACGNNAEDETTTVETTTEQVTSHTGNAGNIEDTTQDNDKKGVIDDIGDDIESGVRDMTDDGESALNDGNQNNNVNNNNKTTTNKR